MNSLCVLAYKRPELLRRCLESIWATVDEPCQIIVNLDGGDTDNSIYLFDLYKQGRISNLVLNAGKNRGVGRSMANCVGLCEGDFIFKIDTDLEFRQGWLSTACNALRRHSDVGAVSLFNYNHYDPADTRFVVEEEREDVLIVNDLVSSVYGFRTADLVLGGWNHDDGFHQTLKGYRGKLAITKTDLCKNDGFGVKSVYVTIRPDGTAFKTKTNDSPLIFGDKRMSHLSE